MTESSGASSGPLEEPASPRLAESAGEIEIRGGDHLWRGFTLADLAHVTMLAEQDLIPESVLVSLTEGFLELADHPPKRKPLDAGVGDIYRNRENRLDAMGVETGWMGLGRPRREASTLAYQLTTRKLSLELADALIDCGRSILALSRKHTTTLMPDYTYNQRAQPTSFGHYCSGFVSPLLRDLDRLRGAFEHVNRCPAGTGSTNGSRLPLDRNYLAELLGFDGLVEHARDAMWQADGPIELGSLLVTITTNLARLANDLQLFSTQEFNFVELADRHSRSSVMMPQKKNPYALAFIRGVSGELDGLVPSMASAGRTTTGQVDNRQFPYHRLPEALTLTIKTVALTAEVLPELSVDEEAMQEAAEDEFSCSTDLAEHLVQTRDIDYRTAHRIVGETVRRLTEEPEGPATFTASLLNDVAGEEGVSLDLAENELTEVLDPLAVVNSRRTRGGAAPEQLTDVLEGAEATLEEHDDWADEKRNQTERAEQGLFERARGLVGGRPS